MINLALGSTGLDEEDVTIFHNIVLALGHDLAGRLDSGFVAILPQGGVVVHDGLNEGLLKVSVNHTSGRGRLGALADSPLTDFVCTSGEETGQVENLAHSNNNLGQSGLGVQGLALLSGLGIIAEGSQTLLEGDGNGDERIAGRVLLDPLKDLGQVLVLLTDVVLLAEVDQIDNGLGREQEERVDNLNLLIDQLVSEGHTTGVNRM